MERAPLLRPVPSRPPGPIAPVEAVRHAKRELPGLDEPAVTALALIALAGRSREEVGGGTGLAGEELADALARARKALRRKLHPLPGSGWCERAERLISDRMDGALEEPGPRRLEAHLINCSRCVEHERRLAHAQDALVAGFIDPARLPDPPAVDVPARPHVLHAVNPPALFPLAPSPRALPVPAVEVQLAEPPAPDLAPSAPVPTAELPAPDIALPAPAPTAEPPPRSAGGPASESKPAVLPAPETPPPSVTSPVATAPPAPDVWPAPAWLPSPAAPPATYVPAPRPPSPRSERARPLSATLEVESTWTTVGPLVVVLALVVVLFALAGALATGA